MSGRGWGLGVWNRGPRQCGREWRLQSLDKSKSIERPTKFRGGDKRLEDAGGHGLVAALGLGLFVGDHVCPGILGLVLLVVGPAGVVIALKDGKGTTNVGADVLVHDDTSEPDAPAGLLLGSGKGVCACGLPLVDGAVETEILGLRGWNGKREWVEVGLTMRTLMPT